MGMDRELVQAHLEHCDPCRAVAVTLGLHLGLGLHIVRLVAEAHGGSVEARNLPDGGGVAFTLHLPAG